VENLGNEGGDAGVRFPFGVDVGTAFKEPFREDVDVLPVAERRGGATEDHSEVSASAIEAGKIWFIWFDLSKHLPYFPLLFMEAWLKSTALIECIILEPSKKAKII